MGEPRRVVTAFVRHRGCLLLERTEEGLDGIVRPVEGTVEATIENILASLSCDDSRVVRTGDPIEDERVRYPVLIDLGRATGPDPRSESRGWYHAPELREGAPGAWEAYRRVSPTVSGVVSDEEHGSTTLSLEALQLLRDEAAAGTRWPELESVAKRLIEDCGAFTALVTRIDRTMTRTLQDGPTPAALARVAREELEEAVEADREAARRAADRCTDATVLTLSRSGTVLSTLAGADPGEVIFLESRPGYEGVSAAESLAADGIDVGVVLDAAAGDVLCRRDVDVVLVGADSIDPNGDVRNKVGTRLLATAAQAEGVPVVVVTASDKIADIQPPEAWVDGRDIYDGPADIETACRLFDRTPPELVDELVTEVGSVTPDITVWIAAERRRNREWRERSEPVQSA